jgi:hypothetical protein
MTAERLAQRIVHEAIAFHQGPLADDATVMLIKVN